MAVGVANPKAQGQAMTNTATEVNKAWENALSPPIENQTINVSIEIPITTGTNIPAILSTNFWTGALLPCASCTIFMIWDSKVSPPTFSAVN